MRDIIEICNEKNEGESLFLKLHEEIGKEIRKGTDFDPYLSVKLNVKRMNYEITLTIPLEATIFNPGSGDQNRAEVSEFINSLSMRVQESLQETQTKERR